MRWEVCWTISIHALLAESDKQCNIGCVKALLFLSTLSLRRATIFNTLQIIVDGYFYPRSPCGERRCWVRLRLFPKNISIHALLAESDGVGAVWPCRPAYFYPRSPCGERRLHPPAPRERADFYPRSPCGERPQKRSILMLRWPISIHALLAESDIGAVANAVLDRAFLSTLSLRRATLYS